MKKMLALLVALIVVGMTSQAADAQNLYISLKPDSRFCTSVTFGGDGRGEYILTIDDPEYPDRPWADIHRASFNAGPGNPIIVPVCISTEGRKKGSEAVLKFNLDAPEDNITYTYGVCVSDYEDIDETSLEGSPCALTSVLTDVFSADLIEPERTVLPGEKVSFDLIVSSSLGMTVTLDRADGPKMVIGATSLTMPGEQMVKIDIEAPSDVGDYPFSIKASVVGCDKASCEKTVEGILHVAAEKLGEGFSVDLSPSNVDVIGVRSATYYLTVHNFESIRTFSISFEVPGSIQTDFEPMEISVGEGMTRRIAIVVVPKIKDMGLYYLRGIVQDSDGKKMIAEASLTVDEAASDAQRAAENNPKLKDEADDYVKEYEKDASLDDWEDFNDVIVNYDDSGLGDVSGGDVPLFNWIMVIVIAVAVVAAVAFYIYKKGRVTEDAGPDRFIPLDAQ